MSLMTWRFTAFDSLFFRESRPFDSIGSSELSSVFPPSPATMAGAIRSVIGEHKEVIWRNFPQGYPDIHKQIGDSGTLGEMRLKGIFLGWQNPKTKSWERLYPVPAHLVATKEKSEIKALYFLQVGAPVKCDLGEQVCLPVAPKNEQGKTIQGIKPLEGYWLTLAGLTKILNGDLPNISYLVSTSTLFAREARLGIARNNQTCTVETGMLYQTQHVRPKPSLCIEVDVDGLDATIYPEKGIVRLGGEGRGAAYTVVGANNSLPKINCSDAEVIGIKLLLLSAVHVPQLNGYTPLPGFKKAELPDKTVWQGQINGIALTLHCVVMGKVLREGGWDLRKSQAKPVRSLLPAGSVFYCTVDNGDIKTALEKLQTAQLVNKHPHDNPLDEALGRGLLTAGLWQHDNV